VGIGLFDKPPFLFGIEGELNRGKVKKWEKIEIIWGLKATREPFECFYKRGLFDMRIAELLRRIKNHPDFDRVGMILCHNGVVRGFSRDGRRVTGVKVDVDHERLDELIREMKARPGITDILAEVYEGKLSVGDDIMYVLVAGDIRDNVFPVLVETVSRIKKDVVKKEEELVL